MSIWTIVVAAGSGTRFGGAKQFELLNADRVIDRSIAIAKKASDGVVVVLSAEGILNEGHLEVDALVIGGATRSESVRAGLASVPADAHIVLVHDAARPLASIELYQSVIAAIAAGADAAIPGVAVGDTLKRVDADMVVQGTVDRTGIFAVQTPQAFSAAALHKAHASSAEATDDAGLVEADGGRVVVVAGDPINVKITERRDIGVLEAMCK